MYQYMNIKKYRVLFASRKRYIVYAVDLESAKQRAWAKHKEKWPIPSIADTERIISIHRI